MKNIRYERGFAHPQARPTELPKKRAESPFVPPQPPVRIRYIDIVTPGLLATPYRVNNTL